MASFSLTAWFLSSPVCLTLNSAAPIIMSAMKRIRVTKGYALYRWRVARMNAAALVCR